MASLHLVFLHITFLFLSITSACQSQASSAGAITTTTATPATKATTTTAIQTAPTTTTITTITTPTPTMTIATTLGLTTNRAVTVKIEDMDIDSSRAKFEVESVPKESDASDEDDLSTTGGKSVNNSSEQGSEEQSVHSIFDLYEDSIDGSPLNVTTNLTALTAKPARDVEEIEQGVDIEDSDQEGQQEDTMDPCLEEKPTGPGPCRALISRFYYDRWEMALPFN